MSKRFLPLSAIVLALLAGSGSRTQAAFTTQTSVFGVTDSRGDNLTATNYNSGSSFTIGSGAGAFAVNVGAAGASSYTDSLNTTIYFLNDFRTAGTISVPNEQIFVSSAAATDTTTFSFSLNIAVNGTQAFTFGTNTTTLNIASGNSNYFDTAGILTPPTFTAGGFLYTSSTPKSTDGDVNSPNNGTLSAHITATSIAVPEPASIAMLGLGLSSVGGFVFARRRKSSK